MKSQAQELADELNLALDRYKARLNLVILRMAARRGRDPIIVRWMPRR